MQTLQSFKFNNKLHQPFAPNCSLKLNMTFFPSLFFCNNKFVEKNLYKLIFIFMLQLNVSHIYTVSIMITFILYIQQTHHVDFIYILYIIIM